MEGKLNHREAPLGMECHLCEEKEDQLSYRGSDIFSLDILEWIVFDYNVDLM